jgi:hypothetical protein
MEKRQKIANTTKGWLSGLNSHKQREQISDKIIKISNFFHIIKVQPLNTSKIISKRNLRLKNN